MSTRGNLRNRLTFQTIVAIVGLVLTFALITLAAVTLHLYDAASSDSLSVARGVAEWQGAPLNDIVQEYNRPNDPHVWILSGNTRRVIIRSPNAPQRPPGSLQAGIMTTPTVRYRLVLPERSRVIVVDWPLTPDLDLLRDLILVLALVSLGSTIVGIWLGRWITKRVLEPVGNMTASAEAMLSTNNFHPIPAPSAQPDEFSNLAAVLSRLITTLEDRWQRNRTVLAEAAHQLRTPLEVIRGNLDLIQGWDTIDHQTEQESLSAIDRAVSEMTDLVRDLLTLEHAGNETPPVLAAIDLASLIEEVGEDVKALEPAVHVSVEPGPRPLNVLGHLPFARRALWAIAENALQYCPRTAGKVLIKAVNPDETRAGVMVQDNGPGIPPDDLPHIFNRFYRGRTGRTVAGTGLGLSIARALMQSQQGSITVQSGPEGTTFVLWFSRSPSSPGGPAADLFRSRHVLSPHRNPSGSQAGHYPPDISNRQHAEG